MGEMKIRLDDAVLVALRERAESQGKAVEQLVADIVHAGLGSPADRSAVARAILARTELSPISSVELLDQIRDEGR